MATEKTEYTKPETVKMVDLYVPREHAKQPDLYIAALGEKAQLKTAELCAALRADGFKVETDICGRGLKAQMKYANKIGAKYSLVLGDTEIGENSASLKNMADGEAFTVKLDTLSDELFKIINEQALNSLEDLISNNL